MPREPVQARVSPQVLRWARESGGLTVAQVASRLEIPPSQVEAWEDGSTSPALSELERLAHDVYKRPLAALLLPNPPEEVSQPKDFRILPPDEREPFSSQVYLAFRRARRVARIISELGGDEWPRWERPARVTLSTNPDQLAQLVRGRTGINVGMQLNWSDYKAAFHAWRDYLQSQGIVVLQLGMPIKEARGFSLLERGIPVVVVNVRDYPQARSFSLLHEYCHLLLDNRGVCRMDEGEADADEARTEAFCNRFAAAFLVPADAVASHRLVVGAGRQRDWPDATIRALARDFKVSQEVALRRLVAIGRASGSFYRGKREEWAAQPSEPTGGRRNPPKECVERLGVPFVRTVLKSRQDGRITRSDVADYLGLRLKHMDSVERILRQEGA